MDASYVEFITDVFGETGSPIDKKVLVSLSGAASRDIEAIIDLIAQVYSGGFEQWVESGYAYGSGRRVSEALYNVRGTQSKLLLTAVNTVLGLANMDRDSRQRPFNSTSVNQWGDVEEGSDDEDRDICDELDSDVYRMPKIDFWTEVLEHYIPEALVTPKSFAKNFSIKSAISCQFDTGISEVKNPDDAVNAQANIENFLTFIVEMQNYFEQLERNTSELLRARNGQLLQRPKQYTGDVKNDLNRVEQALHRLVNAYVEAQNRDL